jgi:hypothetical protein
VLDFNERRQLTDQNKQRSETENWEISKPLLAESHGEDNGH